MGYNTRRMAITTVASQIELIKNFNRLRDQGKNPQLAVAYPQKNPYLFIHSYDRDRLFGRVAQCFQKILIWIEYVFGNVSFDSSIIDSLKKKIDAEERSQTLNDAWRAKNTQLLVSTLKKMTKEGDPVTLSFQSSLQPLKLPVLSRFESCDLTLQAAQGKLDPFFGRKKEIEKIVQILGLSRKNVPLLFGFPREGKTAIIEGIAQKIVQDAADLPPIFKGKRIFRLERQDFGSLANNIKLWLLAIFKEANKHEKSIILFIDDLDFFLKIPEIKDVFCSSLAKHPFLCLTATSDLGLLEKYRGLSDYLSPVCISDLSLDLELSADQKRSILQSKALKLEVRYKIQIADDVIEQLGGLIVNLSILEQAVTVLDEVASEFCWTKPMNSEEQKRASFLELLVQLQRLNDDSLVRKKIQVVRKNFSFILKKENIPSSIGSQIKTPSNSRWKVSFFSGLRTILE